MCICLQVHSVGTSAYWLNTKDNLKNKLSETVKELKLYILKQIVDQFQVCVRDRCHVICTL